MHLAFSLPNVQEWILIAVVAVLLFGRRLPEVIAQVLHAVRVARQHLEELRRTSGFDQDLREARRAIEDTRTTVRREVRELTAPVPSVQKAKDAVSRSVRGLNQDLEEAIRTAPPPPDGREPDPEGNVLGPDPAVDTRGAARPDPGAPPTIDPAPTRGPDPEPSDPERRDAGRAHD